MCRSVCGVTRFWMPARCLAYCTASHTTLGVMGTSARPAVSGAWEEVRLGPHPPVIRAERREQRRTQRDVAITTALAAFDAEHHPLTVDVADLELTELRPPQTGTVQRQQQRPVVQVLRPGDEALDFFCTQHDG